MIKDINCSRNGKKLLKLLQKEIKILLELVYKHNKLNKI
jgi:hypothetical protein